MDWNVETGPEMLWRVRGQGVWGINVSEGPEAFLQSLT